jgi:hypothetical protein
MLYPVKDCGQGVNKDLLPSELAPGVWSDVLNIEFGNGFGVRRGGFQAVYTTPTAVPYFLLAYVINASTRYLIQAGTATIFADDGTTRTNISPASAPTGGVDDRWTGGILNGIAILNNGVNAPMYWNGDTGTDFATLTSWTAGDTVQCMRPFLYYLFQLGYTPSGGSLKPYRIRWSSAADPGSIPGAYTAAATNDAGEIDRTEAGPLVDCLPLGETLIIYGRAGRIAARYVGGTDVFSFDSLPGVDGILSKGCVCDTPKGHVFFTGSDVMIHSGGEAVSIAKGRIKDWLSSSIDSSVAQRSFVVANPQRNEVWVCFPSTGATTCDRAAVWNWNADTWTIYTLPNVTYATSGLISSALNGGTWSAATETWESVTAAWSQNEFSANESRLLVATSDPKIGLANTGGTDFGTAFEAYRERVGIRPYQDSTISFIRRGRFAFDGDSGVQCSIYFGTAKTADETPTYEDPVTFVNGTSKWANRMTKRGMFHAVKIVGTDEPLGLRSYELDLREVGSEFA